MIGFAELYFKCPDETFINPEIGILLAETALKVDQQPNYYKVLAEGYALLKNYELSVAAMERAVDLAKKEDSSVLREYGELLKLYEEKLKPAGEIDI